MTQPSHQLQLPLVWADADIHEVVVYARSEHFSGATSLYVAPGQLAELADQLSGFPSSRLDERSFVLGQSNLATYGEVRARVYCRDSTGHIGMFIEMECAPYDVADKPESCALLLRVVPSDLDRFIQELRGITAEGHMATLINAA